MIPRVYTMSLRGAASDSFGIECSNEAGFFAAMHRQSVLEVVILFCVPVCVVVTGSIRMYDPPNRARLAQKLNLVSIYILRG